LAAVVQTSLVAPDLPALAVHPELQEKKKTLL
jgi:hypothetical protein